MLLWLFKQLAPSSHRDLLLIETQRLAGLDCGWERLIILLPRVQMQQQHTHTYIHPLTPSMSTQTHKHATRTHKRTDANSHIYLQIPLRYSISGAQIEALNWQKKERRRRYKQGKCHRSLKWRCGTSSALSFPAHSSVAPHRVTRAWCLCVRSNEEER